MHYDQSERKEKFADITRRIADGRSGAFNEFYAVYGKMIFAAALTVCRNNIDAEETLRRVMAKIRTCAKVIVNVRNPEKWLFGMTRRMGSDLMKTFEWLATPEMIPAADEFCIVADNDEFYYLICDLPVFEQEILIYKFIRDFDLDTIAEVTEKPTGAVKSAYIDAVGQVKEKISKQFF